MYSGHSLYLYWLGVKSHGLGAIVTLTDSDNRNSRRPTAMSGFERILARVGGDALRDYCSSAIEDELKSLKGKMESCLAAVEQALQVQDAIVKLNVPLEDSAAAFKAVQKEFKRFNADLEGFVAEQKKVRSHCLERVV